MKTSNIQKRSLYALTILIVTLIGLGLRLFAAARLDVDYDEHVYLAAAVSYAEFMRAGELNMLAWNEQTYEHPALYKILYGAALLAEPPVNLPAKLFLPPSTPIATAPAGAWAMVGRYVSVFWGTLAVLALSLLNPLAGLFMAVDTLAVKYTSEMYLEALPLLTSLLCALASDRWFARVDARAQPFGRQILWLLASAALLGITVAGKYIYGIVGLAIVLNFLIFLLRRRVPLRFLYSIVVWSLVAVLVFFISDPYLWPHPIARLIKSVSFHEAFQQSSYVARFDYPLWQPVRWLAAFSTVYDLGPASAFLLNIDTAIFVLALVGLPALFRRRPLYFWWLVIGAAFLLLWQTKWPQYALIVMAPLGLSAACGVFALLQGARRIVQHAVPGPQPY